MEPERWRKIDELFHAALECEEPRRAAFLAKACSGDDDLRHSIELLLARHKEAEDCFETPTLKRLAKELAEEQALAPAPAEAEPELLGQTVSRYTVLERLGGGGMGVVYKARDAQLGRFVALKFLREELSKDPQALERLKREARSASALNHPNIITLHEIGEQDGRTFIVMELVDGKPLHELIPRKGMRLTEALRIAAQVSGALTAAHAAGIVHRDLKPANIMVDAQGRVKVLDFGLAKVSATAAAAAVGEDESTRAMSMDQPFTEEGVILGSVPYMSPEQAEGRAVDARSDIFSFGAVLYEMITGQRAFRGESRGSTLAAVVEKDPPPLSEICPATPPELERLIVRCLRKDVNRRSQSMADVKVALDELRDESESGKLARPNAVTPAGGRRWLWPAVAVAFLLSAASVVAWIYVNRLLTQSRGTELVRVSPDDGHHYFQPAISPDGGFVAYISDCSGKNELWLQQVGGGDPIQLTHSTEAAGFPSFFPDGKRILYVTTSADNQESSIEAISALGGEPRVLTQGGRIVNWDPMLSPDGRQIAYFEYNQGVRRLMTVSSNGGHPRELTAWARFPHVSGSMAAWTSDSRYVICQMFLKPSQTASSDAAEWFAFPVDGGKPANTGAGDALRAAGLRSFIPAVMTGDRMLFGAGSGELLNTWEIRLSPGSWHVRGVPHQLTFGTVYEVPNSISATGTIALDVGTYFSDPYVIPLSPATGQPTGVARRLTRDGRSRFLSSVGGDPRSLYFRMFDADLLPFGWKYYALDLDSGKQALVTDGLPLWVAINRLLPPLFAASPDGRQVAYSVSEGDSYSIHMGAAGAAAANAQVLCKACGKVQQFSPDGRFLFYQPEARVNPDSKGKLTVRLLEVASGEDKPWLQHPTDSVAVGGTLGQDSTWVWLSSTAPGSLGPRGRYLVRWRQEPVPQSEWIKIPLPDANPNAWRVSPTGSFYYFEASKLMMVRFDPQKAKFSEPREVKFVPGSPVTFKPDDDWAVRGPGLAFSPQEYAGSVWLMKLPR